MTTTRIDAPLCVRCMGQGPLDCPACRGSGRRDVANLRTPTPTTKHVFAALAKCEPTQYPSPPPDGVRLIDRGHAFAIEYANGGRIVEIPISHRDLSGLHDRAGMLLGRAKTIGEMWSELRVFARRLLGLGYEAETVRAQLHEWVEDAMATALRGGGGDDGR